jgi:hypothetical protein
LRLLKSKQCENENPVHDSAVGYRCPAPRFGFGAAMVP